MTLRDILRTLRERWRSVLLLTVLATGIAVLTTSLTQRVYQASVQIYVASNATSDPLTQYQASAFIQNQVATYADIVASPDVLRAVKQDLNLNTSLQDLKSKISATAPAQRALIDIDATDSSPDRAANLANSTARAFIRTVQSYSTPSGSKKSTVRMFVTSDATAPNSPITPRPVLNIVAGIFVGLLLGIVVATIREVLDSRIKTAEKLEALTGKTVMGVIVEDPKAARHPIAARAGTRNIRAENFRQLRANLQFANVDRHPRVIAVTSSVASEGKTTVALNLASTLAEAGFTVCLVDADLRRPTVARSLGLPNPVGLTNVLIHQIDLATALQDVGSNLHVLSSGPTPPNPSEVLASSLMRETIRSLLEWVDYVVLDSAPLLPVADGSEVAATADGTLLVVRQGTTKDTEVKRAQSSLQRVDATLLGVVLNRLPVKRGSGYGYSYYREDSSPKSAPKGAGAASVRRPRAQVEAGMSSERK